MLLLHVRIAREDAAKRGVALTVPDLADTLRRLGYAVKMCTALGGGPGGACLRSLRHSFLTVSVSGPSGSTTYLLDPRFREQVGVGSGCFRVERGAGQACRLRCALPGTTRQRSARSPFSLPPPSSLPSLSRPPRPAPPAV